jgi:hypothetical protein
MSRQVEDCMRVNSGEAYGNVFGSYGKSREQLLGEKKTKMKEQSVKDHSDSLSTCAR